MFAPPEVCRGASAESEVRALDLQGPPTLIEESGLIDASSLVLCRAPGPRRHVRTTGGGGFARSLRVIVKDEN